MYLREKFFLKMKKLLQSVAFKIKYADVYAQHSFRGVDARFSASVHGFFAGNRDLVMAG